MGSKDGCSYDKGLRLQLAGGVGLVVRFQITSRMLEGNVEYFNYLDSMITNDATGTREIESSFAMTKSCFNPLKPELNSICYLLALLGAHHFLHVSRIRVKLLTLR